jgi:hypothetical protein
MWQFDRLHTLMPHAIHPGNSLPQTVILLWRRMVYFAVFHYDSFFRQKRYLFNVINSFIHQWLYSPLLDIGPFFTFVIIFMRALGLLGRVISPSQGRYFFSFSFFNLHRGGWSPNWPFTGLLYLPRVIVRMENLVE